MNEQRFWLVSAGAVLLLLGLIYWLHTPRGEVVVPEALSPEEVSELINEAVAPLQETISEQAAALAVLAQIQEQIALSIEDGDLRETLEQEIADNTAQTRESLKSDLETYEARLNELQARADDPAVANEIAATRAEIGRIEVLLNDLTTRVDCATLASRTSVRTFVVPSRSTLEVPDDTVVLSVGRLRSGIIDAVSINARASLDEPISTRVIGEVAIGNSIEFRHESSDYVVTFTHATKRFLSSALIGVELRSSPIDLAECR